MSDTDIYDFYDVDEYRGLPCQREPTTESVRKRHEILHEWDENYKAGRATEEKLDPKLRRRIAKLRRKAASQLHELHLLRIECGMSLEDRKLFHVPRFNGSDSARVVIRPNFDSGWQVMDNLTGLWFDVVGVQAEWSLTWLAQADWRAIRDSYYYRS